MSLPQSKKRIIVCCDGTWQNSDNGYVKSNRNKPNIREAYAFLCANYVDGDEIVLLGFSRGAFTARSIGGMISDLGLLTREGMQFFYPIFKDMQNWSNDQYEDLFPTMPFTNKPKGENAAAIYRERLVEKNYTRAKEDKGQGALIQVLAIGVWDTVGSLGIPDIEFLSRLGIKRCTHEYVFLGCYLLNYKLTNLTYQFYNTHLSTKIQHGFHALALDETRGPFAPTLWERRSQEQNTSDLRQVWFPGSHANIGGGWPDQGIADTTLAWMMDQLSSVGCEFLPDALEKAFEATVSTGDLDVLLSTSSTLSREQPNGDHRVLVAKLGQQLARRDS
ncbi:hypothetical protein ONZ43_g3317 [Nemania bipapillata]|uniref:Uncharacterized protein n=1 Tax=Nemania bipapillata TaxID=110536 RepID=A0ACC2IX96_9PEZI|nr:hypothetical protein ONZ43_g3317 [Nemania bipapillata]